MLDSLYLHSYAKQTASMLISPTAELADVQLILKFLGTWWWKLISCHSQRAAVHSLNFILMCARLKLQPHIQACILEF